MASVVPNKYYKQKRIHQYIYTYSISCRATGCVGDTLSGDRWPLAGSQLAKDKLL